MSGSGEEPRSQNLYIQYGVGIFFILISFLLPIIYWQSIPDRVPMHFNFFGKVDSWGGKGILLILPVLSLFAFGLLFFVAGSPIANYPFTITDQNAERQYAISRRFGMAFGVDIAAFSAFVEWKMIRIAQGHALDLGRPVLIFLGVTITLIIDYLVRAYRAR